MILGWFYGLVVGICVTVAFVVGFDLSPVAAFGVGLAFGFAFPALGMIMTANFR